MTSKSGKDKKRSLGRGLSALMSDIDIPVAKETTAPAKSDKFVAIEKIRPNPDQPRRTFTEEQLTDLSNSIKTKGVIQPLIVRPISGGVEDYEIVAGERRWRAAQIAKLHELPVIIRDFDDTETLEIAIIENIQRADLNPIEEAAGYRQLMFKFGHTQEKLASALGKSRSHIANLMRLLNLPDVVQDMVVDGKLSAGHARTVIGAQDPVGMAKEIVAKGLSVREAEKLLKLGQSKAKTQKKDAFKVEKDADTQALEGDLSAALEMPVSIDHKAGGEAGKIVINYKSLEQLDILCMKLGMG